MENLAVVTWTNIEYEDVFPAYFGNIKKYFPEIKTSYVLINQLSEVISDENLQLVNSENDSYAGRLLGCLEHVEEEYFLYMQEDFLLYDKVDIKEFNRCFKYLKESDCSCVRMIRSNCNSLDNKEAKNIYKISHNEKPDLSFTQQPSIWKKKDFVEIITSLNPKTFRDLESYGSYNASAVMAEMGLYSSFYFDEKSGPRGGHFDSRVFPYIATALIKGKWNRIEYPEELAVIAEEYGIDLEERGCV
jgi:hypothetical protein